MKSNALRSIGLAALLASSATLVQAELVTIKPVELTFDHCVQWDSANVCIQRAPDQSANTELTSLYAGQGITFTNAKFLAKGNTNGDAGFTTDNGKAENGLDRNTVRVDIDTSKPQFAQFNTLKFRFSSVQSVDLRLYERNAQGAFTQLTDAQGDGLGQAPDWRWVSLNPCSEVDCLLKFDTSLARLEFDPSAGLVTIDDLSLSCTPNPANPASCTYETGTPGTVPEPGSLALLGVAGLALIARRRRATR